MSARHISRQKEFELQMAEARSKMEEARLARQIARRQTGTAGARRDTEEPRRRARKRVVVSDARPATTKALLLENVILLIVLTASIIGLYMLIMYLLNQPN